MAKRKLRVRTKGRTDRLKNNVYKAAVIGLLSDPEGTDARLQRAFDDAVGRAYNAGLTEAQMKAVLGKAIADAKEISDLLDEAPNALVKLTDQDWEIEDGGGSLKSNPITGR